MIETKLTPGTEVTVYGMWNRYNGQEGETEQVIWYRRCAVVSWGRKQAALRDVASGDNCKFRVYLDNGSTDSITLGHTPCSEVVGRLVKDCVTRLNRTVEIYQERDPDTAKRAAIAIQRIEAGAWRLADRTELTWA